MGADRAVHVLHDPDPARPLLPLVVAKLRQHAVHRARHGRRPLVDSGLSKSLCPEVTTVAAAAEVTRSPPSTATSPESVCERDYSSPSHGPANYALEMDGGRRLDGLEHGVAALAGGLAPWGRDPLGHQPSGTETETAPCPAVSAAVPPSPCRQSADEPKDTLKDAAADPSPPCTKSVKCYNCGYPSCLFPLPVVTGGGMTIGDKGPLRNEQC
ncbi:hypothetical protein ZWY2020_035203 [Hordeum vulgare]|nr:hypothetical protein ZWY2020_035203 [Hordeum vulgare]